MQYHQIRTMDVSNGPGVRVSLFVQGCEFHCPGCFNPDTHDFSQGKAWTDDMTKQLLDLCDRSYIAGLSILGGEPLHPNNIETVTEIARRFRERFPKKTLWIWSGYNWEQYIRHQYIVQYADVIVDGQFQEALHHPNLKWRGSSNQRVIDVPATVASGIVVSKLEENQE